MSYILDALRRAEAERQSGQVPGLASTVEPAAGPRARGARGTPWAVGFGVVMAGLAVWALLRPSAAPVAGPSPVPTPAQAPVAVTAPANAQENAHESAQSSAQDSAPVPATAPAPLPLVVSAPSPQPPAALPGRPPGVVAVPPAPAGAAASAANPQTLLTAPAPPKPLSLAELGESRRRELPPLAVGGSVWSDSAPSRFVILDGQVLREGDTVAPGLVLERIERKSILLRWRELRLELKL
jgi:general secretion pathway protein B